MNLMDPQCVQIREENEQLTKAIGFLEKQLETTTIEKEQINALYLDFKQHYESMKNQLNLSNKRLAEETQARRELELAQDQRVSEMKRAIDSKQRELEQLQNKLALPMDTDILRMRIAKDLESRHKIELDQKQIEVDRLSEQYYEAKRQLDVLKAQIDTVKSESEKELSDLKEKHSHEMHDMLLENQALQTRADDKRDRELIRQLRRDLDESKRRLTDLLGECTDLRRERDLAKMERNEIQITHTKEIEDERNQKRLLQSEIDRISFKLQCSEEERTKLALKVEKKQSEVLACINEKNQLDSILREKDALIESLNKQVGQLKEDLRDSEGRQENLIKKLQDEEREMHTRERKEKSKLQKEIENLQQKIQDFEWNKRQDLSNQQREYDRISRDYHIAQEEKRMLQIRMTDLQQEVEALRIQTQGRNRESDETEKEFVRLKERHRDAMVQLQAAQTAKDHLEASMKITADNLGKLQIQYENDSQIWRQERQEFQLRLQELISTNEKQKIDAQRLIETLKTKYQSYKTKLRSANTNVQTLAERVAKYELQLAAERENIDSNGVSARVRQADYGSHQRRSQFSSQGMNIDEIDNHNFKKEIDRILAENQALLK